MISLQLIRIDTGADQHITSLQEFLKSKDEFLTELSGPTEIESLYFYIYLFKCGYFPRRWGYSTILVNRIMSKKVKLDETSIVNNVDFEVFITNQNQIDKKGCRRVIFASTHAKALPLLASIINIGKVDYPIFLGIGGLGGFTLAQVN